MAHGPENVPLDLSIAAVKLIQQALNVFPLRILCGRTRIDKFWESTFGCKPLDHLLIYKSKRSDNRKFVLEHGLGGDHRADLSSIAYI